jgi:hypothetical protein
MSTKCQLVMREPFCDRSTRRKDAAGRDRRTAPINDLRSRDLRCPRSITSLALPAGPLTATVHTVRQQLQGPD